MAKTSDRIIEYIKSHKQATANELADFLLISERAVFKQLANLVAENALTKIGKPPKVFYLLAKKRKTASIQTGDIEEKDEKIIEQNFLIITPDGQRKEGLEGFVFWCEKTKQPVSKTAREYVATLNKYDAFKKNRLISGLEKFRSTFSEVYLDKVFYVDFYGIERFGKTRLGQLLLYAKQSQDKKLIRELAVEIKSKVDYVVDKYEIDGIGFIPPTVKRQVQFMRELEKNLHENVKKISIVKVKTEIVVPQKTLNKLEDRIENARNTIVVDDIGKYNNILLIDDAVGSGATLNETARQMREKDMCKGKIIGLSITGSFKGFDVISEV